MPGPIALPFPAWQMGCSTPVNACRSRYSIDLAFLQCRDGAIEGVGKLTCFSLWPIGRPPTLPWETRNLSDEYCRGRISRLEESGGGDERYLVPCAHKPKMKIYDWYCTVAQLLFRLLSFADDMAGCMHWYLD
ncbi:unnamed protein product [Ectocarpus sp. 6 AP-2014]